ncbi:hypothetical protein BC943DRAFT_334672 [Umbelopsis sp. AD052]|nr:hypothetical protein BC943DRAFT_334672 [Umbelopsis sp. AD052]
MTNSAKEAKARLPIPNFQRQIGITEDDFLRSNAVAMNIAPAWKHFYKLRPGLGYDIPSKNCEAQPFFMQTRGLYRCLLRESARFQEREVQMFLRNTISERFHFHHRETSIPRSLKAIHEAEKSLTIIRAALSGDSHYYNKLVDLGMGRIGPLAFVRDKIKRISNPAKTSMMVKNSVKAVQRRLDRFQTHQEYLQMLDGEALFLKTCGVNTDDVRGAETPGRSSATGCPTDRSFASSALNAIRRF